MRSRDQEKQKRFVEHGQILFGKPSTGFEFGLRQGRHLVDISLDSCLKPFSTLGLIKDEQRGAASAVVKAQTVMDSVASNPSS